MANVEVMYPARRELLCRTAYLITPADKYPRIVIPAQAGIQQSAGCRIKSGMTVLAI